MSSSLIGREIDWNKRCRDTPIRDVQNAFSNYLQWIQSNPPSNVKTLGGGGGDLPIPKNIKKIWLLLINHIGTYFNIPLTLIQNNWHLNYPPLSTLSKTFLDSYFEKTLIKHNLLHCNLVTRVILFSLQLTFFEMFSFIF